MQSQPVRIESTSGVHGLIGRWLGILRGVCARAFAPSPPIRQWVESQKIPVHHKHNRMAAEAGETWNFTKFHVVADWTFDFVENAHTDVLFTDGKVRRVANRKATVIKDSQSGLTTIILHALAWWAVFMGGNIIYITDVRQQARDFVSGRVATLWKQFKELMAKWTSDNSQKISFDTGDVFFGGGQSATDVISKPGSMAVGDEVARHELIEGKPSLRQLESRIKGDDGGKLFAFSSPGNALEHDEFGKPIITAETIIHSSYLRGTQERPEVPCPTCGFYQPLIFEQLRFQHCKESMPELDGGKPIWNKERVAHETYYQCANPDCPQPRIEESQKADMMLKKRYVGTNPNFDIGHRSLMCGGMYNLAFADSTWGAIANEFLASVGEGGEAAMKSFYTDKLGIPFSRFKAQHEDLRPAKALRRGYRRIGWDGDPARKIPLNDEAVRFVGMTCDVQRGKGNEVGTIGEIKYLVYAAGWDGQLWVLDWGSVPALDDLPTLVADYSFSSKDSTPGEDWTISCVAIDTGYRGEDVMELITFMGGSSALPRWVGVRGDDEKKNRSIRGEKKRSVNEATGICRTGDRVIVRTINLASSHWEHELHVERIARPYSGHPPGRPAINLPVDTDDAFLSEVMNVECAHVQMSGKLSTGIPRLVWRKRNNSKPADFPDLIKYGLVIIDAVTENETTQL